MIANKIFRINAWRTGQSGWRSLVALAGILVLTTTLAGRTFAVQVIHRPTAASSAEKAKIQHRDKQKTRSAPATIAVRPFYVLVIEHVVEPEQKPLFSAHIDDCRYNRPPPRS